MIGCAKIILVALCLEVVMVTHAFGAEVGETIPDFVVQTFDGRSISRASLAGKPALLVFWNTWCFECERDLPKINRIAREYGEKVAILAINTALNDSEEKARAYWKRSGFIFPTGYDRSFEIRKAFKVRGVPTVLLVDAKGIVRYKNPVPPGNMGERLKMLLN
jgi:thiol-disulfide isomerase/thioredoxin